MARETQPEIKRIGKYAVIDVIGAGGMGIVYRAHDAALNRTVAIKMLKRTEATDAQASQVEKFFNRELLATASLQHRNIVTVYESGNENGDPYLVMECLDGEPLSKIISERRPMSLVEKLEVLAQVCDGLQYAHDRRPQVIHRDIKPANVILLKDRTAKLVDFGIARIAGSETGVTQTGQLVGSLSYMSPEQINSSPIDPRTDIFSVGVLAYEFIAYALPFKGSDPGSTFVKILREDPESIRNYVPDIPPDLEEAILHALAKKPQDRYQTAEEFGFDLLGVQRRLKQGMTAEFLQRAEAALERGELDRAKQQLLEITRLDRHHERANRLLAEVRKAIQGQERAAQVVQMRSQAQIALTEQQYEEALACVEQAVQLDPQDEKSIALREEIKNIVALTKNVREMLGRAESAMLAGDLDDAKVAVQQALSYDAKNTEARALATMIENELAERSRRAQVQNLVDNAREGISRRQFEDAIQSLRKAEELDPTDSNVRELMQWATRGKEQELRRKELLDLTEEIDRALRMEDFSSAFTISELALARFPNEQTIVRLKSIAEKQKGIAERRQYVHDQSLAAKDLIESGDLNAAIKILESGLAKISAEPNLEALLAQARKLKLDQEASVTKAAEEQAAAQSVEMQLQRAREEGSNLQRALDEREQIEFLEILAITLSKMLSNIRDEQTRRICEPLLEQVRLRAEAKRQVHSELVEFRKALAHSADAALRHKASGRMVEAKAAFPRERDIRTECDEIAKLIESAREDRARVTAELSRIAEEVARLHFASAQKLMARSDEMAAPYAMEPQIGALIQQIHFEVDRRGKRLQARIREITNLENAIAEAVSLESISQLLQNAIAIGAADAEEPAIISAVESARRSGDARRQEISEFLTGIEEITNRALAARSVNDAEAFLAEARTQASKYPTIEEIQRNLVRVAAQIRGRRVEHDLVRGELESLIKSAHDNPSIADLESVRRRASEVHDKYLQERTLIALCKDVEAAVETAKDKFLQLEIERVREEDKRRSLQDSPGPQDVASSVRRLEDLVQAYPDNVELRSFLLKAQEALARVDRAQRNTLRPSAPVATQTLTQTGDPTLLAPAEVKRKGIRPIVIGVILSGAVTAAVIGWLATHRASGSSFTLTIDTLPDGANVEVNGQSCASRPCKFTLPANATYEATADLDGYSSADKSGVLTHNDSLILELKKSGAQPVVTNVPATTSPSGRLMVRGLHPGDRLFVDEKLISGPDSKGGWSIDSGLRHFKLMDGSQELIADPREVNPGATVTLNRSDFRVPAPLTSDEQLAWNKVEKSPSVSSISEFLKKYPNSSKREEAGIDLENLTWLNASRTGTIAGYRDFLTKYPSPQGQHFNAANDAIDQLAWQGLQNSSDVNQLSAFLAAHPKGPYHDLASGRLDDLSWNGAKSTGKVDAIRTYLRDYPNGRHRDEANDDITSLTPKPAPPQSSGVPQTHTPQAPAPERAEDDVAAVRRALDNYQDAYQSRSIDKLRALWPTISSSQASNVDSLFKRYSQIEAPYSILSQNISGDDATVVVQQFLAFGGQKPLTAKMTINLKKRAGGTSWYINSIR